MRFKNLIRYEAFIFIGALMAFLSLIKLIGEYNFSSDWFWFIAGIGLIMDGTISFFKQRKFDKKFKILGKEEYEKLIKKKS